MSFKTEDVSQSIVVRCPESFDSVEAKELEILVDVWLAKNPKAIVFDFSLTKSMDKDVYRTLLKLKTQLTEKSVGLYALRMSTVLAKQLQNDGVDNTFQAL